ncbi:protein E6-like [Actinidia eriantha]|uniref:protein E6-like n=1 Tax=Actinidia eriantha TaxID=165200 RepID=UPI00258E8A69|nr:protein E6-like [Actinidia eriantha]
MCNENEKELDNPNTSPITLKTDHHHGSLSQAFYIPPLSLSLILSPWPCQRRPIFQQSHPHHRHQQCQRDNRSPQKEQEYVSKQEQEPSFIPDTQNGYGLYGHESGQFPPTTTRTTTSLPYTTTTTNKNNNNNNYYNNEAYVSDPQGMSDTRFGDKAYTTPTNNNDNNNYYHGANNYYNTQQQPNNYYNTQKQGMSDTRFLENGKYYYDGHANGYKYNNKGHYGNFNENSYEQYQNSMEGYQQQNQEEFQEREEEYVP